MLPVFCALPTGEGAGAAGHTVGLNARGGAAVAVATGGGQVAAGGSAGSLLDLGGTPRAGSVAAATVQS